MLDKNFVIFQPFIYKFYINLYIFVKFLLISLKIFYCYKIRKLGKILKYLNYFTFLSFDKKTLFKNCKYCVKSSDNEYFNQNS